LKSEDEDPLHLVVALDCEWALKEKIFLKNRRPLLHRLPFGIQKTFPVLLQGEGESGGSGENLRKCAYKNLIVSVSSKLGFFFADSGRMGKAPAFEFSILPPLSPSLNILTFLN